jgi:ribose transport system permease protein
MKSEKRPTSLVNRLRPGLDDGPGGQELGTSGTPQEPVVPSRIQSRQDAIGVVVSEYGTIIALVALVVLFSVLLPHSFLTVTNLREVLTEAAPLAVISIGLTIVAMVGEFDLSVGYNASYTCLLVAGLMSMQHFPALVAIAAVFAVGAVIGIVNGVLVSRVGVNSVIATLGVGTVVQGLNYAYTGGAPVVSGISAVFLDLATDSYGGIPLYIIVAVVIMLLAVLMLRFTRFGQEVQAVGGNTEAARLAGVRVTRTRTGAFVICGVLAAMTGMMTTSLIGSGASDAGDSYLLSAFAAVFLGSATFRAGRFNVVGTIIGVLIIQVSLDGLAIFGEPSYAQDLLTGGILIVAVSTSAVGRRLLSR